MKSKIDYLNIIEKNVRDEAQHFVKSAIIVSRTYVGTDTEFIVNTVKDFFTGDEIYMADSDTMFFGLIKSIDSVTKKIVIGNKNLTTIETGTQIKKNDAIQYLENALYTYSKFRPLIENEEYTGTGSQYLALPANWQTGFSSIMSVRYPYSVYFSSYLDPLLYRPLINESGELSIYFNYGLSGALVITYSRKHFFDEDYLSSAPDSDIYCICDIASAYYLLGLASRYAQSTNPTISADTVDYQQKPNQYIILYNVYLNKAAQWLGIDVNELKKGVSVLGGFAFDQQLPPSLYDDDSLILSNQYFKYY